MEESPLITQNEEVTSTVGRNNTTLVGTDEADKSDLDDQLISTDFKSTDDNDSDNNSGRNEEISDNEEEDNEEESQGVILSHQKTAHLQTKTQWKQARLRQRYGDRIDIQPLFQDISIPLVGCCIPLLRKILREL